MTFIKEDLFGGYVFIFFFFPGEGFLKFVASVVHLTRSIVLGRLLFI